MLCRRPNRTLTNETRKKKKSSGYVLATLPIQHFPPVHSSGLVAVGSNIYHIGGSVYNSPVSILDGWSHTWHEAPSMRVEWDYPSASVLDGKIYVTGGVFNSSNWMEVLDPITKTSETVSRPPSCLKNYAYDYDITKSAAVDGKVHIFGENGMAYNPKDGTWNGLGSELNLRAKWSSSCVIENVLYYYYYGEGFKWYDTKLRSWRTLKGMERLPKFARHANVRLADYCGKMALFWDKFVPSGHGYNNRMIWCAMIVLERRNNEEIWGEVEWFDLVLPHPIPVDYRSEFVGSVTV